MITTLKQTQLKRKMRMLGIHEADLTEKFIIGSGRGGQNLHKTASCVYLKHEPTGFEVKCQKTRSREANRYFARRRLCEHVETHVLEEKSRQQQEIEKNCFHVSCSKDTKSTCCMG